MKDRTSLVAGIVAACLIGATAVAYAATLPEEPLPPRDAETRPGDAPAAARKPRTSQWCYTQYVNCIQSERQAVGASCWCITPFGPSFGRVR